MKKRQSRTMPPWYLVNEIDGTELVLMPGGWFRMGAVAKDTMAGYREKPGHLHYVAPFYMGITCVTVRQFAKFVEETRYDGGRYTGTGDDWVERWGYWQNDAPDHPVRYVNWEDATAYCEWVGLHLPAESEWEYCARGYAGLVYPWGDDFEAGRRICRVDQKGPAGSTVPVYDYPEGASPMGTFQQSGNLWEWCVDRFDIDAYKRYAQGDFSQPETGRFVLRVVLRGGSWSTGEQVDFRGGNRRNDYQGYRVGLRGFRAAKTIVPS